MSNAEPWWPLHPYNFAHNGRTCTTIYLKGHPRYAKMSSFWQYRSWPTTSASFVMTWKFFPRYTGRGKDRKALGKTIYLETLPDPLELRCYLLSLAYPEDNDGQN